MSADKFIQILEAEVGYLEKKSNSQLEDKTANAGYNNWTKYGVWYGDNVAKSSAFYNTYWCAMFISWGSMRAGTEAATGYFAYCPYWVTHFKNKGEWFARGSKTPQRGDIIFFQSGGTAVHVGAVYNVSGNTVYTIEGNTSSSSGVVSNGGGVYKKSYALSSSYILGYGRPSFTTEPDVNGCPYGSGTTLLKKGSKGVDVSRFQWYSIAYGQDTGGLDGSYGDKSVQACKNLQLKFGLLSDGECGTQTWSALIENYKTMIEGELSVSQYNDLTQKLVALDEKLSAVSSQLQTMTATVDQQVSPKYNKLEDIPAGELRDAAQYFVEKGIWKGEDGGNLAKSYIDLKSATEIYRVLAAQNLL